MNVSLLLPVSRLCLWSSENDLNSDTENVEHELPSYMSHFLNEYEHRLSASEILSLEQC